MAIGKFFAEAITEGIIFRWIIRLWDTLKGNIGNPVVQEWAKNKLAPKGLDDEATFTYILAQADMKKSGSNKKNQLIRVMSQLETADATGGTRYVQNFRLIIAMDAIGHGTITAEKKDKDGKVVEIRNEPDPKWEHPGISILEILAEECSTDDDMIRFIIATGAMQDAPFGTIDELKNWAKKTAWPLIVKQYEATTFYLLCLVSKGETYYKNINSKLTAFEAQPLWKKIIDPRNWFKTF